MDLPTGFFDLSGLELPQPDDAAIDFSQRLVECIVARIEKNAGLIGFDEYMQMVLSRASAITRVTRSSLAPSAISSPRRR